MNLVLRRMVGERGSDCLRLVALGVTLGAGGCPHASDSPDQGGSEAGEDDAGSGGAETGEVPDRPSASTADGDSGKGTGGAETGADGETGNDGGTDGSTPMCKHPAAADSLRAWTAAKEKYGDTYWYAIDWSPGGFISDPCRPEVTFQVIEGEVISRMLTWTPYEWMEDADCPDGWSEERADLGTHDDGAPPRTMDELYRVCCEEILTVDPTEYDTNFDTRDGGLLGACGWWPMGCADGCGSGPDMGHGIYLTQFEFGEL